MRDQLLVLFLCLLVLCVRSELVLENDDRKAIEVAAFGFLSGGRLSYSLDDYHLTNASAPGVVAFYIRKGRVLETLSPGVTEEEPTKAGSCFLDNSYIKDEVKDGISDVRELSQDDQDTWHGSLTVGQAEEGLWQVILINCKESTFSLRLNIEQVNPGNNYLSAGDTPLPLVYSVSSAAYVVVAAYWTSLLVFRRDTRVFRAHWLMLVLVLCIIVNKALQSEFLVKAGG
ncbi:hypothetical protein DFQ28_002059 [Apophysomyces sp. BC1034]|nr:hypothetical protein DFQ30_002237 [Apophysomyces sp. BC1015]KAG0179949.1 hypothetical protein DFQ29_001457 [Apophysomyces sp. BC1021]KAG0190429.1 hypothetical protein DFQ28_002059 [Apophysomyces sp. BC1034]